MNKDGESYKLPNRKITERAIFWDWVIFKFQIKGIGNIINATSVKILGIATARKYLMSLMHSLGLVLIQNPSIGEQEKSPTSI